MSKSQPFGVLFVCLGNICRSPLAEGVFRHIVNERDLTSRFHIDSCGTGGWHIGEPPHEDSIWIAARHGVSIEEQRGRQVARDDFDKFDLIVAMDQSNHSDLVKLRGKRETRVICLREYDLDQRSLDVPDPYYGGRDGFENVFDIIHRCCIKLLDELVEEMPASK